MSVPNRATFSQQVVLLDPDTGAPYAASGGAGLPVVPKNITSKFREAFEAYVPGTTWDEVKGTGDLIHVDGNAAAASYLVISKDPLVADNESSISSVLNFRMPVELAFGASMSQRTTGQEFAIEIVDTGAPLPDVLGLEIASISQATTVLTVDTARPHGLSVGKSIGIQGCANAALNYPALVVASAPSPTQFTCTAGPAGTIVSQTQTVPSGAKGSVYFRERFGRAQNGISQIFENWNPNNASLYIRSESGDALPSGTVAGNHSIASGSTTPMQLVNSAYQYAFAAPTEYRIFAQADRVQWADSAVDAVGQTSSRLLRTQVCPDPDVSYRLRIRATNNKSLTVPNAQIISATKTGTTTAMIVTDRPHGLALADPVVIYGIRDQAATAFPNLLTATAVASITSPTSFTIVIGTAATVTSYGGYVAKVQGGNLMSALGGIAQAIQSATLSTLIDGTRQLALTGSTTWAGLTIGDGVNVIGCRDAVGGATVDVEGAWKVANMSGSLLFLVPLPGNTPVADFTVVNCGGAVIKRTELRLSFVRIFDYERQRVEMLARPAGDLAASVPVVLQGGITGVFGTLQAVTNAGTPAAPATPLIINSLATTNGQLVVAGTSGVQALFASNTGAAAAYVKLYNKATAPIVGVDVPAMIVTVPAAVGGVPGEKEITPGFNGYRFPLGLGVAITAGVADADTTAVAAGQVKVMLSRTV